MEIKVAFGSVPKDGGTFTFYRNIRPALLKRGIDMRCAAVGSDQAQLWENAYVDNGCTMLAPETNNIKQQAKTFVDWCTHEQINIVIGVNSPAILSAIPHLAQDIRVLSRCANAFDHGYRITMSGADRLARIVALTPRLQQDLIRDYNADPKKIVLIPNGISPATFEAAAQTTRGTDTILHLGFLGRLEHNQKGVLHIPKIVKHLNARGISFDLKIAGKGRHRTELETAMRDEIASRQVTFLGALSPSQVPDFLARTDVFVFTSHFEGCPNALLEALMAGSVPVSWRIDGITDYVIDDGKTGFLCELGNINAFADSIANLATNRQQLQTISRAASAQARKRFTDDHAADAYADLFKDVMAHPPPTTTPKPWDTFRPDPNFPQSWKRFIPTRLKNTVKRLGIHNR